MVRRSKRSDVASLAVGDIASLLRCMRMMKMSYGLAAALLVTTTSSSSSKANQSVSVQRCVALVLTSKSSRNSVRRLILGVTRQFPVIPSLPVG